MPLTTRDTQDGTELDQHVVFFDVNEDGRIGLRDIHQAMRELGFSEVVATLSTPVLWLIAGGEVKKVRQQAHDDTGSFRKDGAFDQQAFADWFAGADRDGSGDLSRFELARASLKLAADPVSAVASVGEFQLVAALLAEDGGLTRKSLESFLDGSLFREIVEARSAAAEEQPADEG